MRNLRSANEFVAQRKKRNIWRNVVTCIAAFVVFCTTYALILPAITMEKEDLSCGLEEHAHSSACYQLTCGKPEVYSHTHTRDNCYNSDGALICTLREQTAHHHTQDCYSKPQPACGQVEHAAHTHGDDCYTDGALTCILTETPGHTHSDACYPADFTAQLVCGKQDLPEHRHSDACYIRICGKEEHAHSDACADSHQAFIENLDQLTPTADEQPAASEAAVTQPEATGVEASEAPTETEAATHPETQTEAPTEPEATDQEETETPTQEETETPTQEEETEGDVPEQTEAVLLLAAPRMASDGNPERLVDVATSVTVSGTNVKFDKDKQRYNADFSVKFKFAVKTVNGKSYIVRQGQTENCGTEFIMSLGELKITDNTLFTTDGHPLRDGGNMVGRYFFEKDSEGNVTLRIRFTDEKYIASASEENGIGGTISMSGNLGKKEADSDGKITYPVDGDVKLIVDESDITYPEGVSSKGDMSLSKHGSYSTDGKKLTYTVSVGTTNGTPGKIRIEDVLNLNGLSVSALESVKVDGRELDSSEYTYSNGGSTQTISMELPKLEQWGSYSITYVYTLSEAPENSTLINNKVKATTKPDEGGTEIKLERESNVTVTPDQTPTNPTDPSETNPTETQPTTPTTPPVPDMWKSNNWSDGSKNENKTVIPWVITVNNNRANVAGMTLSDTMLSQRMRDDAHRISVKVNWGNELTDPNDYSQYLTINDNGTITFKALEEGKNTNCYVITYYTDAGSLGEWGKQSVSNTAIFGEKTSTSTVDETGGNLEKKTDNVYLGDDNRIHMDWTAIITLGKDGILLDQKIADFTLPYGENGSGKHYYTPGSIQLTYNGQSLDSSYFEAKLFAAENGQETTQDATYMEITMLKDPSETIGVQESGNKLTLTYSTYAKQEELNGNGNWKNKVAYRSESKISEANITPPSFQKTDGNNQSNTTSLTNVNGDLEWKVKTTLSSISKTKTLVITDHLPEHVHVLELSIQSHAPGDNPLNAQLEVDDNGNIAGSNDEYAFTGTCKKEDGNAYTVRLTVASLTTGAPLEPETTFTLKLKCCIDEDYLAANASSTFTNRADGTVEEGSLGSDEQTQEWTRQEVSPVEGALSKYAKRYTDENGNVTAWNRSDQTLDYVLEINPDGKDIQPGSSKVYLVDEFTYRPEGDNNLQLIYNLVQSSVKLYYAKLGEDGTPLRDASGNLIAGDAVSGGWRWTADEDNPDSDYNATWITKFIRLEVPDATPLILYYSYQLEHHNEEIEKFQLNAKNKAYFLAYPDQAKESDQTQTDWKSTTTTGEVYTGRSLTITKMEEGNSNVVIKGAQFKVYKAVQDESGAWQWSSEPLTLTSTDDNHTVREYYETDYIGRLMVKFDDGYETNVLYKLVETKAANGYFLPDSPPTVKFYFKDDTNTTVQLPEAYLLQDAKNLSKQSVFEDIYNTPNDANFSVEKVWMDSFGNNVTKSHSGSVMFELVQLASETKQDTSVVDPLLNTAKVTVKIGAYGDAFYTKSATLPKGSVVTVRITVPDGVTPEARTYVTGNGNYGDFYNNSVTVPAIRAGNTYTFQITVTHNINFEVHGNTNQSDISGYSCTVAMPSSSSSSGSGEAMQFEPKVVDTITLSDSNGWHWSSAEHKDKVPLHGVEYDEAGGSHNVWYTYYVREISGGYDPVYSNWDEESGTVIGLSTGAITVTNTLPPPPEPAAIEIQKQWSGLGELEKTEVNFRLIRKQWDHAPTADELQTHEELAYDVDLTEYPELLEIGQYTLTKVGGWKWSSENVVTLDSYYNGKWYTYFIIEEPGNYSVTYPKEISSGTLTVVNTTEHKPTSIEVDKQWFDYFGKDVTQDHQGKISFELHRVTKVGEEEVENSDVVIGTYDVSQTSNPAWKWSSEKEGLILYSEEMKALTEGAEKVKVTYEYYVVEKEDENATEKFTVEYKYGDGEFVESDTTGISSGSIIIKNTLESPKYELPKTGGTGTLAYTLAGLLLTLTSALALTQKRRKGVS